MDWHIMHLALDQLFSFDVRSERSVKGKLNPLRRDMERKIHRNILLCNVHGMEPCHISKPIKVRDTRFTGSKASCFQICDPGYDLAVLNNMILYIKIVWTKAHFITLLHQRRLVGYYHWM
ncbi:hypothetical protein D3C77_261160 [compost metagenome]